MLDIHSHILPGVDDGSRSPAETMHMLAAAKAAGVDRIVATPHLRTLKTDFELINRVFLKTRNAAVRHGISLFMGFEVDYRVLPEIDLESVRQLCLGPTKTMLLELPVTLKPVNWEIAFGSIIRQGCHIIIAHPERYSYVQSNPEFVLEMCNYGCSMQVDVDSLYSSRFGAKRKTILKILKSGWADCIASDAHRPDDYRLLADARREFGDLLPTEDGVEGLQE